MVLRIGMTAVDLVRYIYITNNLLLLEVFKYQLEEIPHFAEVKKINPNAKRPVAKALKHTSDFNNRTLFIKGQDELHLISSEMIRLRDIDQEKVEVEGHLEKKDQKIYIHEALCIASRVRTKNGIFHIPLLDMDLPIAESSLAEAEEVARGLGIDHGAIVNSGKSYHFWGFELLSESSWRTFMYRALLLDRVDSRWIGHRLLDGHATLRISPKRGQPPVIDHIF